MTNQRLQEEEQFHSKNYILKMPRSHAKMRLISAPQELNFLMAKAISKSCALDCSCKCPCTFRHSYAIVTQPQFRSKPFYVKIPTSFLARTIER